MYKWLFCQILFDVITLDWRNLIVDFLHLLRNYIYCLHDGAEFSKTYPSFLTVKEGSTSHLGLLSSGEKKETALLGARNRYAIRLADHQRSSPYCAGWDRLDTMLFMPNLKTYFI